MPFAYVIQNLAGGQAAKRPSWGGYVKKTITTADDAETETYTLTFVKRNGAQTVYTWNGSAFDAPATPMSLDGELFAALAADDWIVGSAADYEAARTGTNVW